jgi:plastocyanin
MLIGATLAALSPAVALALPSQATMVFGRPDLGSGCQFPDCVSDKSFHAVDKVAPGSVSIAAGGTVDFDIEGFHQVAIYAPGTKPSDIEADETAFPFVNDDTNRIFLGGIADASFTFSEPGKYLVICNIAPHFEDSNMWGWVQVK